MSSRNRKPRIAVPVPTLNNDAYNERCLPEYAAAIEAVGGDPVRFALSLEPAAVAALAADCDAVLLPGSPADVHPQKYGEAALGTTAAYDPAREAVDELLLQDAFHLHKPIFGICFGLQMMNVWRGGTLKQHLEAGHTPTRDKQPLTHTITVMPDAPLLRSFFLDRTAPEVNSSHHQAVAVVGDGLRVSATAKDGVIEAVEGTTVDHFILGVQWHPERSYTTDQPSRSMFTAFIDAAHQWRLPRP